MDKGLYVRENLKMLSNQQTYKKLTYDPKETYKKKLVTLVEEGINLGIISKQQADFICVKHQSTLVFYSFPKVQKPQFPHSFCPIVSGISSLNENLCFWVDSLLHPFIPEILSFLRDTQHVLAVLDSIPWQDNYLWITADVTFLNMSIPDDLANLALIWFLDIYSDFSDELKMFLISAVIFLLKHNFIKFDNEYYLQISGATMGAKFSPALANIFMA